MSAAPSSSASSSSSNRSLLYLGAAALTLTGGAVGYYLFQRSRSPSPSPVSQPGRSVTASASGKALITGGYLVLDRDYSGLVSSLSARFHTTVRPLTSSEHSAHPEHTSDSSIPLIMHAPQRCETATVFALDVQYESDAAATPLFRLRQLDENERNKYFVLALRYSLVALVALRESQGAPRAEAWRAVVERLAGGVHVLLRGDYQFYTSVPPPANAPMSLLRDNKTGLGSSAALVSSLVGAIFAYFGVLEPSFDHTHPMMKLAHNVAQFAHCAAQGKIGSGFDIAAAFFGTQRYTRFSPELLQPLLDMNERDAVTVDAVREHLFVPWNNKVDPFVLPPGLRLVLGDVKGGSETPSMVRKVLAWRKADRAGADQLWGALRDANSRVEDLLNKLSVIAREEPTRYHEELRACTDIAPSQLPSLAQSSQVAAVLVQIRDTFQQVRAGLRAMGDHAGVPIEPPEQTELLDYTMDQPGVLISGVPGAGGVDAIFALVLHDSVVPKLNAAWRAFANATAQRLPVEQGQGGILISYSTADKNAPSDLSSHM